MSKSTKSNYKHPVVAVKLVSGETLVGKVEFRKKSLIIYDPLKMESKFTEEKKNAVFFVPFLWFAYDDKEVELLNKHILFVSKLSEKLADYYVEMFKEENTEYSDSTLSDEDKELLKKFLASRSIPTDPKKIQ